MDRVRGIEQRPFQWRLPLLLCGALACADGVGPAGSVSRVVLLGPKLIAEGGQVALQAAVVGPNGGVVLGAPIHWATSDPATVSVSPGGLVRGQHRGHARVFAESGGRADTLELVVSVFSQVSVGAPTSCGLVADGSLYCWGQLLTGDSSAAPTPVYPGTTWRTIRVGGFHACGLDQQRRVSCWGWGSNGEVNGTVGDSFYRTPQLLDPGPWDSIEAGIGNTCAWRRSGGGRCWGGLPGGDANLVSSFRSMTAGAGFACGLLADGTAFCLGEGRDGQLGDGMAHPPGDYALTPVLVTGGHHFAQLSAGGYHVCGLTLAGAAYCWGEGTYGALGSGQTIGSNLPILVPAARPYIQLAAGAHHTCGLRDDAVLECWGWGDFGEVGTGGIGMDQLNRRLTPGAVYGGRHWVNVTSRWTHTCATADDGDLYCWGWGYIGQLGDGTSGPDRVSNVPVKVLVP